MGGFLGARIGEGATADVYAWAPGRVVKLFKTGIPRRISMHEARMTRAVFAAGALAPELFEVVIVDGRVGLVMARLDGPSLVQSTKAKTLSFAEAGEILARCLHAVHATSPPSDVPHLRDALAGMLEFAGRSLPDAIRSGVATLGNRLPADGGLCHGDPNPGNVIMTADGPRLIDWIAAVRCAPAFDLASAQVMLTELAPLLADNPERPRAINAALQAAYAPLAKVSSAGLAELVEPYLPIVRTMVLLNGALPQFASTILRRLQADLS